MKCLSITGAGAAVVVATGANGVVVGLVEEKRDDDDDDGKPVELGAIANVPVDGAPNEIGAAVVVVPPNGAIVDEPPPNANEEVVADGTEVTVAAGVAPNPNVDD